MRLLVVCALVVPQLAFAGELETFLGGGASVSAQMTSLEGETAFGLDPVATQVEVDGAVGWEWGFARVDLDAHFDPNGEDLGGTLLAYPGPWPEWAMVQVGRDAAHVRAGIFNANTGLEDWDPWVNYAPTYSNNFVFYGPGRWLGGEVSYTTSGGVDLFAFGGRDVDWGANGGGVGVATAQDSFATWSGLFVYPSFTCADDSTCLYGGAQLAFEFYPADPLWLDIDVVTGIRGGEFFSSQQLLLNIVPEATVNPFLRGEFVVGTNDVGAPATAGGGVRSDILPWLRLSAEGKALFHDGAGPGVGATLMIAAHRPEPIPYSYSEPFTVP